MTAGNTPSAIAYTAQCLCAGVRLRIAGELAPVQVCHCSACRHAQGTPFATNIPVAVAALQVEGAELLTEFESSPGKLRVFCRRCGSPVWSRRVDLPDVVRLRAGLVNEPLANGPLAHFHAASRSNWWPITDGLPQFDASGPARPGTDTVAR